MKELNMTRLSVLNIKEVKRKGQWKYGDPEITGVETSSLRIEKGYIFVAKPSKNKSSHGALFSNQAFKKAQVWLSPTQKDTNMLVLRA